MLINEATKARFYSKVDRNGPVPSHCPELGPCHVWTAGKSEAGYGKMTVSGKNRYAHRLAFHFAHGRSAPEDVLHRCDNPSCVNPEHLFEGNDQVNVDDRCAKGRSAKGDSSGSRLHPHTRPRGERHGMSKLSDQDVRDIRANYALCRVTKAELSRRFRVSAAQIKNIINRTQRASV